MKKKVLSLLIVLALIFALGSVAFANSSLIVDDAALLYSDELREVNDKLNAVSAEHNVDICIVTTNTIGAKTPAQYADDYFDNSSWGQGSERSGVLLLINMGERDVYISTCGYGIEAITDYGIDYILKNIKDTLGDGDYEDAFLSFAELCDEFLDGYESGQTYDYGNRIDTHHGFNFLGAIVCLVMGLITAFIVLAPMKSKLKSVVNQVRATSYIQDDSLNLAAKRDTFMYRNIVSRPIHIDDDDNYSGGSSTHTSFGGMTHGGGGSKF